MKKLTFLIVFSSLFLNSIHAMRIAELVLGLSVIGLETSAFKTFQRGYCFLTPDRYSTSSGLEFLEKSPSIRNNMASLWKQLDGSREWETLQENNLICLKSPIKNPGFNLAWGITTPLDAKISKGFFKDHPFTFVSLQGLKSDFLLSYNCTEPEIEVEMYKKLESLPSYPLLPGIKIKQIQSSDDYKLLILFASKIFAIPYPLFFDFCYPMRQHFTAYFAYFNEELVGTSQFYIDEEGFAGIQTVTVLEKYRRKGIGKALTNICLEEAFSRGAKYAVLGASKQGEELYKHMGFKTSNIWELRSIK